MPMNKNTIQKILSDPEFDPSDIFGAALSEYLESHPSSLGSDVKMLKHLVMDPSICTNIVRVINVNNLINDGHANLIGKLARTISHAEGSQLVLAAKELLEKMSLVSEGNIETVYEILKEHTEILMHPNDANVLKRLKPEYACTLIGLASATDHWGLSDWNFALQWDEGIKILTKTIAEGKLDYMVLNSDASPNIFQTVSRRIKTLGMCDLTHDLTVAIGKKWDYTHICFKCGQGAGMVSGGKHKCIKRMPELKSLSGYTLHRNRCDPKNEYLSPWEILYGHSRIFTYKCERCGYEASSTSGLSLHEKFCTYPPPLKEQK